jgi:hypothetical protein
VKPEEWDFETQFQTALAQFDDAPDLKTALIALYQALCGLLLAFIRTDARRKRGPSK